jgi:hypothetical protein
MSSIELGFLCRDRARIIWHLREHVLARFSTHFRYSNIVPHMTHGLLSSGAPLPRVDAFAHWREQNR